MNKFLTLVVLLLLTSMFMAACGSANTSNEITSAVEGYIIALNEKDLNQMIYLSCADWEAQAQQEYDSFAAVTTTLEGLECQIKDQGDNEAQVSCSGQIIASYGDEDLVIELNEWVFQVVQESGEWRMCGHQ